MDLAQWVKRQRYQFQLKARGKHSTLTDEREQVLESVGFVWDAQAALWEERFQDLLQFQAKHGHCRVPSRYPPNTQLAAWAKCQRRQRRLLMERSEKPTIVEGRMERLDSVGFVWSS